MNALLVGVFEFPYSQVFSGYEMSRELTHSVTHCLIPRAWLLQNAQVCIVTPLLHKEDGINLAAEKNKKSPRFIQLHLLGEYLP